MVSIPKPDFHHGLLAHQDDVVVTTLQDLRDHRWGDIVELASAEATRIGARLLVVDTLSALAGLVRDQENSAGAAYAALRPLQHAAAQGLAVLVTRHSRKSGGAVASSGRGSSAFSGAADIILGLQRPRGARPTVRTIEAVGRFRSLPPFVTVERVSFHATPQGLGVVTTIPRETFLVIPSDQDQTADASQPLLPHLSTNHDEAKTIKELATTSSLGESSVRRAVAVLMDRGDVARLGASTKRDPYRYVSSHHHHTLGGGEKSNGSGDDTP